MYKTMLAWLEKLGTVYANGHALYATDHQVIHARHQGSNSVGVATAEESRLLVNNEPIVDLAKVTLADEVGDIVMPTAQLKAAVEGMSGRFVRLVLRDGQLQLQTADHYALLGGLQGDTETEFFDLFPTTETAVSANGSTPAHSGN